MVTLSTDVLCLIFSQLIQSDQLECMTVCRQWHDTILHRTLSRVVYINHEDQLNALIDKVKKDPLIGARVDSLNLYLTLESNFDDKIFIKLFPNLREFVMSTFEDISLGMEPFEQHEAQGWRERMKKIREDGYDRNTYTLLQSGMCERLTSISVLGNDYKPGSDFIRALTNAPALKELTMKGYYIYVEDLELLHSILPALDSLSLVRIFFDGTDFPRDIKPATLIKSFESDSTEFDDFDEGNLFANYISQKYTNLEELEIEIREIYLDNEESIETATRHRSIITSHLKTLGPKLKTLAIDFFVMDTEFSDRFDFNILDDCECQIKRLELRTLIESFVLEQLSMTTQVQYIESLSVNSIRYDVDDSISLDWLGRFKELKQLELRFPRADRYQVSLIELFKILENTKLHSLTLDNVILDFRSVITAPVYPSVKALTLIEADLKQNMDVFISHSFPNLKQLTLRHSSWEGKTLMLSNLNLSHLEVTNFYAERDHYVMVITLDNNQQRLYTVAKKRSIFRSYIPFAGKSDSIYPYTPSKPYDASEEIPTLTVICRSLQNFYMLSTIA